MIEPTHAVAESAANDQGRAPAVSDVSTMRARPALKLFIPTLVLIVYWSLTEASYRIEMGMFYRFISRMLLLVAMLFYFLGWGFTRRHFSFGQRCLIFVMIIAGVTLAGTFGHQTTGVFGTALTGLPIVISLAIAWLWFSRNRGFRLEFTGIGIGAAVVLTTVALLRWDGLDGRQRSELSWRWTLSPEERFLKENAMRTVVPTKDQPAELTATSADWVSFRGGDREGVVSGVELCDWSVAPPRETWRRRVGPGWSSVIVIGDRLFTQEQRGEQEAVVCYDAKTGQEVWVHPSADSGKRFEEPLSGAGPRATPTFHENRIYAYGVKGQLECLNAATGEQYWTHSLFSMADAEVPMWGSATSPILVDDKVVVFVGGKNGKSVFAFDRLSGDERWHAAGGKVSYSSPQLMTIAGERQILMHDETGLSGIRIDDGKLLWTHASPHVESFQPMLQAHLISDDRLIINWDSGILCLKIRHVDDAWQLEELWKSNKLKPSFNEFVIHGDHIYGLDDGIFCCFNLTNGQRLWKKRRYGFGQMLMLPDLNELLVLTERGEIVRVAIDPSEHREIGRFKAIEGKTWNHPVLAHGHLIVRNAEEMACFEVAKPEAVSAAE